LAGRVDTVAWFIIGVCNYASLNDDIDFAKQYLEHINKGFTLLEAWEFNNNHLVYVPRSGNWADEYITEGYILYDQLLRLWALRCFDTLFPNEVVTRKIKKITQKITENYRKHPIKNDAYHPKAYKSLRKKKYWVASFSPSGYQKQYDAFANALALILKVDQDNFADTVISYSEELRNSLKLKLLPAFWPVITETDADWNLLANNYKYEFRNIPYEFHNGGTWQLVNGFYGLGLVANNKTDEAEEVLNQINEINATANWSFYENFNTDTGNTSGVSHCAWSAAAAVMLHQALQGKKLLT
jgi:GH15 family glucan-1,4-alpha-glucosidase